MRRCCIDALSEYRHWTYQLGQRLYQIPNPEVRASVKASIDDAFFSYLHAKEFRGRLGHRIGNALSPLTFLIAEVVPRLFKRKKIEPMSEPERVPCIFCGQDVNRN
jgi:hypothetical protein